jgi:hypothetical protein
MDAREQDEDREAELDRKFCLCALELDNEGLAVDASPASSALFFVAL